MPGKISDPGFLAGAARTVPISNRKFFSLGWRVVRTWFRVGFGFFLGLLGWFPGANGRSLTRVWTGIVKKNQRPDFDLKPCQNSSVFLLTRAELSVSGRLGSPDEREGRSGVLRDFW